jgi:hypothetical protein
MRRGIALAKLAPPPTAASTAAFSTFSGAGGFGRGRGRGSSPSPPSPVPGEASSVASDEDPFFSTSGRGRGRGRGDGPNPSSSRFPSFPSFNPSSSLGRGRGRGVTLPSPAAPTPQNPDPTPKEPVFFNHDDPFAPGLAREDPLRKPDMSSIVSALGRGKTTTGPSRPQSLPEQGGQNRHMPKREDAAKRAMEILSRAGPVSGTRGRGGTGRGGREMQDGGPESEQMEGSEFKWWEADYTKMSVEELSDFFEFIVEEVGEEAFYECLAEVAKKPVRPRNVYIEEALEDAQHINNMVFLSLFSLLWSLCVVLGGFWSWNYNGIHRYASGCCFILSCELHVFFIN